MAPLTPSQHPPREPTAPPPPSDGNDHREYFRLQQGGWDPQSVATATLDLDAAPPGSNPERILATLSPAAGSRLAPQPAPINFGALGTSKIPFRFRALNGLITLCSVIGCQGGYNSRVCTHPAALSRPPGRPYGC